MNQFMTLYYYECKKIMKKKIVGISFAICVAAIIFSMCVPLMGTYYLNGDSIGSNYQLFLTDKQYSLALDGQEIDQELLEETIAAYRKIPEDKRENYTITEEYQKYARPYSAVFRIIRDMTGMSKQEAMSEWQPNEHDLYTKWEIQTDTLRNEMGLSEGEKEYWRDQESKIQTPMIYREHEAYYMLFSTFQTVGVLVLMLVPISLSSIFYDEHARRTDQMILCCSLGKLKLYGVKISAGISFAIVSTIILFLLAVLFAIGLYGPEGFHGTFQLIYRHSSDAITCGQAIFIAYGCMLITAIFISIFTMVLSELLRSNLATLAVSTGLLIVTMMVYIPEEYRLVSQIWDWLPWDFLAPWSVFGQYTVSVFGIYFAPWQAVPVIYLIASILVVLIGKPLYKRYQISGR